jgi:DNA mismatch repair ATPase MutS
LSFINGKFASYRPYHGDTPDSFLNVQTNMVLDFATQEGLEIFSVQAEDEDNEHMEYNSLADLLDRTTTPFGRRLLRKWLSSPLTDLKQIEMR